MAFNRNTLFAATLSGAILTTAFMLVPGTAPQAAATERAPTALRGIDVVSYFEGNGTPVAGNAAFTVVHSGKSYLFASQQHADAFRANPDAYLPQYGGYCAWAAAQGDIAPGDARHYRVVNGKLYLNYNRSIQDRWVRDMSNFITQADANWPRLKTRV